MRKAPINIPVIIRILGSLLIIEAIFILISLVVSLIYGDGDSYSFMVTAGIALSLGFISRLFTRKTKSDIGKREGYIIVSLVWVVFSFVGALPFMIGGYIPNLSNAFFETMSGFTTTGSTILQEIEHLPHGILFWRSIIQWMGGMGIIVLSLTILPILGIGGMQLFSAEVPGPVPDKLHPRVTETAKRLWFIYVAFTVVETILLMFGGMNFFDAINHSFTTMATGGYSTKNASIGHYDSAYIHWVITVFMFIAGTNFTLAYFAMKLKFKKIIKNEEFQFYSLFIIGLTIVIGTIIYNTSDITLEKSYRDAAFQIVSLVTTTGFATVNFLDWIPFVWVVLFVAMFSGGSAGSTGGGIKVMRILLLIKNSFVEFKRLIHPNAIIPVRFNGLPVNQKMISNILAFIVFYILIFVFGTIVMSGMGYDLDSAMGAVIATLGNIGPGIGEFGSGVFTDVPSAGKWFLSFIMLAGRLELFTVIILFSPAFWKK